MKGKWALVRMAGKAANDSKPNWLLIKEHDQDERGPDETPVTDELPDSVVTGRNIDAIARAKDSVWNSKELNSSTRSAASPRQSSRPGLITLSDKVTKAPKEEFPSFISPQLASVAKSPPLGDNWLHELKLDGYRIQAQVQHGTHPVVRLLTRTGLDWTHKMKPIADAVVSLPAKSAVLDGEVVVLVDDGTTSFAALQAAFQEGATNSLAYHIFDLLHLDGHNLRVLPLIKRKQMLATLLAESTTGGPIRLSEHIISDANAIFRNACKLGAEGIVSKLAMAQYSPGRGSSWLKMKCYREQELVIGGFTFPSDKTHGVGALLLGYYSEGSLIYAGKAGTGFTQKTHRMLRERLDKLLRKTSPFKTVPTDARRGTQWVKPDLVVQISFSNWTADNLVRQAAFKGLREDKPANEVHREDDTEGLSKVSQRRRLVASASHRARTVAAMHSSPTSLTSTNRVSMPIKLTHPDKILDSESGVTKEGLAQYYSAIATYMLPHIADRPLTLVRCVNGSDKPCFYQKHKNDMLPDDIGSIDIVDKKTGKPDPFITLSTSNALIELAQLGVLEIHPWGSCNESIELPDRIVFDLDPDAAISWKTLTASANEVRRRLTDHGLKSFLKATGGKGLHVVVPIRAEHPWPVVKQFAHTLVLAMEKDTPSLYLTRMTKTARAGKIYLDYLRNERGATSIAPFSPRARTGLPVALPLSWDELDSKERHHYTVSDFAEWKERLMRDPWKGMEKLKQRLMHTD